MSGSQTAPSFVRSQAPRRQFLSPDQRKALLAKADELKKLNAINSLHCDILRYFFYKCPGAFTGDWRPSHGAIAAFCGCSARTIVRALQFMKKLGLIDWAQRWRRADTSADGTPARQDANAYFFPVDFIHCGAAFLASTPLKQIFDWKAQERDRRRAAALALWAYRKHLLGLEADPSDATPPPLAVNSFSASLFASRAWKGAL